MSEKFNKKTYLLFKHFVLYTTNLLTNLLPNRSYALKKTEFFLSPDVLLGHSIQEDNRGNMSSPITSSFSNSLDVFQYVGTDSQRTTCDV